MFDAQAETLDVVVVGGGPAGATAANDLARAGTRVALLERGGRIKPCGGAIPPRLIADFSIPERQIVARVRSARMISPTGRCVDIPMQHGYLGMIDRERFDEFLRVRAVGHGAIRLRGTFLRIERDGRGSSVVWTDAESGLERRTRAQLVIGADGARSRVARSEIPGVTAMRHAIAYHEVIEAPPANADYDPARCAMIYDGRITPDFYGWIFPQGARASVGLGTGTRGIDLRKATAALRARVGLDTCPTLRRAWAPIPIAPLDRWDNGRDVVLAGDAAGVVAPSSGEGLYYAMVGGRIAALAAHRALASGRSSDLKLARTLFMREHGILFRVLRQLQEAYYRSDERRERFVSLCHDIDVQRLTFEAYMNKKLVRLRPYAHFRIGIKTMAHLLGVVAPDRP